MAVALIRNAGMVIGWHKDGHRYLPHADIAFENGAITFAGRGYAGPADAVIDGSDKMVTPGLAGLVCVARGAGARLDRTNQVFRRWGRLSRLQAR
jgi:5-methylthioadenosine/S-adenosylhomocysteine deaminase